MIPPSASHQRPWSFSRLKAARSSSAPETRAQAARRPTKTNTVRPGMAMARIPATMPAMPSNVRNPQRSFVLAARTAATIANMPSVIRKTANRPTSDNSVGPGKRNAIKPMMSPKTPSAATTVQLRARVELRLRSRSGGDPKIDIVRFLSSNNSVAPSAWPRPAAMTLFRSLDIGFHRRAGANEVAVSINIVHTVDRRPVFIDPESAGRKAGGLARIGSVPFADEVFDGVRGVLQRIVLFVHAPFRDGPRLLANGEH